MSKKFLSVLLIMLAAAMVLAACNQQADDEETNTSSEASAISGVNTGLEVHDLSEQGISSVITLGTLELEYSGENAAADTINAALRARLDDYLATVTDEDTMLSANDSSLSFTHEMIYEPVSIADDGLISILARGYDSQQGAAHPNIWQQGLVYDASSGEQLTLADLLPEGYMEELCQSIISQIKADGEEANFYPGYEELLPQIIEQENWYVKDGQIHLLFNPDQIAPYALGILEFTYQY